MSRLDGVAVGLAAFLEAYATQPWRGVAGILFLVGFAWAVAPGLVAFANGLKAGGKGDAQVQTGGAGNTMTKGDTITIQKGAKVENSQVGGQGNTLNVNAPAHFQRQVISPRAFVSLGLTSPGPSADSPCHISTPPHVLSSFAPFRSLSAGNARFAIP